MRFKISYSDEEMIEALVLAELREDALMPPNLRTFYINLPKPESQRLLAEALKQWKQK